VELNDTIDSPTSRRQREADGMAAYWNARADSYDSTHEVADKDIWKRELEALIGSDRSLRILDIATGTGLIATMLAEHGYSDVTGVDLSDGMMSIAGRHAAERGLDIAYRTASALDLPYEDGAVDVVISSRLLWTLTEPDIAIAEWARVVRPGGVVIAINELEPGQGIRSSALIDYREATQTAELPLSNVDNDEMIARLTAAGLGDAAVHHLEGCHLLNSERENWYAFTARKPQVASAQESAQKPVQMQAQEEEAEA
jgi:ubiquinone/menaquinone biosynthesis C-methylase UbiE